MTLSEVARNDDSVPSASEKFMIHVTKMYKAAQILTKGGTTFGTSSDKTEKLQYKNTNHKDQVLQTSEALLL